jgi:dipeptidyl aminopeptidase/acylaminoacyl peptidase
MAQLLSVLTLVSSMVLSQAASSTSQPFDIADYFEIRRVAELAISSDGSQVAYVSETSSLSKDATVRKVYLQETNATAIAREIEALADAHDLAWVPNAARLAFLAERSGRTQLFTYDIASGETRQLTAVESGIGQFRFAPRARAVAYLTAGQTAPALEMPQTAGLLVDVETTGYAELLGATQVASAPALPPRLFVQRPDLAPRLIELPGEVQEFHWSSDARWLSVTYVGSDVRPSVLRSYCTSIGLVDLAQNKFSVFAQGRARTSAEPGTLYWGGDWLPNERAIVLRASEPNLWIGDIPFPDLAIVDATRALGEQRAVWMPVEIYPRDSRITAERSRVLIETRVRARNRLFSVHGGHVSPLQLGAGGNTSQVRFSDDARTAAFVSESLASPPEVYVQAGSTPPRQLSMLNSEIAQRKLPAVTEIVWKSNDGVEISGWLLLPPDQLKRPMPLVTYIHGGPGYAFPDQFAPSMSNWPHPLEVLAVRGVAVFIPQYRGTLSFGKTIARPHRMDQEPIEDVISGIEHLIALGVADAKALGIAGHSHGAWLGPLIATRSNIFVAGSFAEGWSNHASLYELYSAEFNREIQERAIGEPSLYARPQRYIELSPDLHFANLRTAMLFEAGVDGVMMHMVGMPKAARHFGVPSDFFVYPGTGHTLTKPRLQLESAERILDWFLYWLCAVEDPDPAKSAQYSRWREMRDRNAGRVRAE